MRKTASSQKTERQPANSSLYPSAPTAIVILRTVITRAATWLATMPVKSQAAARAECRVLTAECRL